MENEACECCFIYQTAAGAKQRPSRCLESGCLLFLALTYTYLLASLLTYIYLLASLLNYIYLLACLPTYLPFSLRTCLLTLLSYLPSYHAIILTCLPSSHAYLFTFFLTYPPAYPPIIPTCLLPPYILTLLPSTSYTYLLTCLSLYLSAYFPPTYLPTFPLTYLPTFILTYLPTYVPPHYLPTLLPSYLPTFLTISFPLCLLTCSTYLRLFTTSFTCPSDNLPASTLSPCSHVLTAYVLLILLLIFACLPPPCSTLRLSAP